VAKYQVRGKSSSPATAAGNSTTATPSTAQNAGGPAPGVLLGISGGWLVAVAPWVFGGSLGFLLATIMRLLPVHWGALVFFSILGVGASFFVKEGSFRKWGRRAFGVVIILHILSAWVAPDAPKSVEGLQPGTSILTPSPAQEEQVAPLSPNPPPEAPIYRERISQIPGKRIVLTKSKTINLPPGQKDICFSWLGYNTNGDRVNQQLTLGGVEFSTQGSNCFPVEMEGEVEVKFLNPPQTEVDTYKIIKGKGGQGEYPFIKLPQ